MLWLLCFVQTCASIDMFYIDSPIFTDNWKSDNTRMYEVLSGFAFVHIGQQVMLRWRGGLLFYKGTVINLNNDGTYQVRYDDSNIEEQISLFHMDKITLQYGKQAIAQWRGGLRFYKAAIVDIYDNVTYNLHYDGCYENALDQCTFKDGIHFSNIEGRTLQSDREVIKRYRGGFFLYKATVAQIG